MAIDLNEIQRALDEAANVSAMKRDLTRAMDKLNRLASTFATAVAGIESEVAKILADAPTATKKERGVRAPRAPKALGEVDADAPYGRKKDGTPKGKPGRGKSAE